MNSERRTRWALSGRLMGSSRNRVHAPVSLLRKAWGQVGRRCRRGARRGVALCPASTHSTTTAVSRAPSLSTLIHDWRVLRTLCRCARTRRATTQPLVVGRMGVDALIPGMRRWCLGVRTSLTSEALILIHGARLGTSQAAHGTTRKRSTVLRLPRLITESSTRRQSTCKSVSL